MKKNVVKESKNIGHRDSRQTQKSPGDNRSDDSGGDDECSPSLVGESTTGEFIILI